MTTFGELKEFVPETEKISVYLERADLYFTANGIGDDKKVPIFLSTVGTRTYHLLRDLFSPDKPQDKTLADVYKKLTEHYEPTPIVIAERFRFHQRNQAPQESITAFLAELRRLAIHCDFGDKLTEVLRDRFVCGLRNSGIQRRLLTEKKLTLVTAVETALGMEAADAGSRSLQNTQNPEPSFVGRVTNPPKKGQDDKDRNSAIPLWFS